MKCPVSSGPPHLKESKIKSDRRSGGLWFF